MEIKEIYYVTPTNLNGDIKNHIPKQQIVSLEEAAKIANSGTYKYFISQSQIPNIRTPLCESVNVYKETVIGNKTITKILTPSDFLINALVIDFFRQLSDYIDEFVTQVEVKPFKLKQDTYITGLKRTGVAQVQAHVKNIKTLMIKLNEYTTEMKLKETPEEEMWIDCELLDKNILLTTFAKIKNYVLTLNNFEVANINYKLKTEKDNLCSQEEVIIYDNKIFACKETIAKRKLCSLFKSKIIHYENNQIVTKENQISNSVTTLTDEEFANMPL